MKTQHFAVAIAAAAAMLGTSGLAAQPALRSAWSGAYTSAQADRGKSAFENSCAKCHGGTLDGNDEIPALKGAHFMADWETQSTADLVMRIHTTMPMDSPGALSTQTATDVVAYLLQQNGMPAGSAELNDTTVGQFRIDAENPGADKAAAAN